MRVLAIVDDTADVRRMVRALLERAGIEVDHEARTIEEAVPLVSGAEDGVIILDHQLEGRPDGLEGAPLLKAAAPGAAIVLFSAFDLAGEVEAHPAIDAFVRKDRILELPEVVRALTAPASTAALARARGVRDAVSPEDLVLARWLSTPALLFGTVPPPAEAAQVLDQLLHPDGDRTLTVLRFVAASGDIDVAVAHLLGLRSVVETQDDPAVPVDLRLLDLLIVEVTSNVIASARRAAMIDPLTGIGNRRALELELPPAIARAERTGRPIAVIYVDLVGLKSINDRDGHDAGDKAIIDFARAMELAKRASDSCYRVGGDEFVAVLVDSTDLDAEAFRRRLQQCGAPAFSMGVAETGEDGFDSTRLTRLADVRMLASRYRRNAPADDDVDLRVTG